MKNFLIIALIFIIISCKNTIDVKVKGYIYTSDKIPLKDVSIQTRVILAPMKSLYSIRTDIYHKNNGEFEFKIKRKEMKGDSNFAILFIKQGYKDEYRFIDLRKNKIIDLDTIYLKK
ncbi:hypothetical protein [Tenacibaculum sp. Bg11-29]|uniref:hypothetical protein n=1 Tax=Tenacibaculum sp. Bg11-29 TaxID=2058306 RepID=UPI0012FEDF42|nr:hypothetical protein [Tenacibaculum sp. Bg11-29]